MGCYSVPKFFDESIVHLVTRHQGLRKTHKKNAHIVHYHIYVGEMASPKLPSEVKGPIPNNVYHSFVIAF